MILAAATLLEWDEMRDKPFQRDRGCYFLCTKLHSPELIRSWSLDQKLWQSIDLIQQAWSRATRQNGSACLDHERTECDGRSWWILRVGFQSLLLKFSPSLSCDLEELPRSAFRKYDGISGRCRSWGLRINRHRMKHILSETENSTLLKRLSRTLVACSRDSLLHDHFITRI